MSADTDSNSTGALNFTWSLCLTDDPNLTLQRRQTGLCCGGSPVINITHCMTVSSVVRCVGVGVRLSGGMIGSHSMMRTAASKKLRQPRRQFLSPARVKTVAVSVKINYVYSVLLQQRRIRCER